MEVLMGSADGAGLHPSHRERFAATSYPLDAMTRVVYSDTLDRLWDFYDEDGQEAEWALHPGPWAAPLSHLKLVSGKSDRVFAASMACYC
jgi:hypothetical protein